jgi:predicted lipid-binding transport protein (Tim44 family)
MAARAPAPPPPPAAPPKPSMWKGVLGGALVGFGLAAVFSHFGMGAALAGVLSTVLMITLLALLLLLIVRLFRRKSPAAQPAPAVDPMFFGFPPGAPGGEPSVFQSANSASGHGAPWNVPADFDSATFLRQAKASFVRMQAAWDKGDVQDLAEFTTPDVFAELKTQIGERGPSGEHTDVVKLDAELLGIDIIGDEYLASVKFSGSMRSAPGAAAAPFAEVWNMSTPLAGRRGWLLAGIQQLS